LLAIIEDLSRNLADSPKIDHLNRDTFWLYVKIRSQNVDSYL